MKAVDEAFRPVAADLLVDVYTERSIHGTHMFGKVSGVEERIGDWLAERLVASLRLVVPQFAADDPRVQTPGFIRRTLRVARTVEGKRFELMTYVVGDTWTIGAKLQGDFNGTVEWSVGGHALAFEFDTANLAKGDVPVSVDGETSELEGQTGAFRGWSWVSLELPLADWAKDARSAVSLRYVPSKGEPLAIPRGDRPFDVRFQILPGS